MTTATAKPAPTAQPEDHRFRQGVARSTMKRLPARIAHCTVSSGRNTPKAAWIAGKKRSSSISSSCTVAAITPMKAISDR